jgi:hypothetical protein
VSCKAISRLELDNTIPVKPPRVKRKINPKVHKIGGLILNFLPYIVLIQLKTLIPVGIAIIIVAAVK